MPPPSPQKKLSPRPVEPGDRQRARQSKRHPDCRSTTIKLTVTQISLALSSGRDNHPPAATAEMAILIVAVFPSRLSRYTLAVVHVKRDQKQNVGCSHGGDVKPDPMAPAPPSGLAAQISRRKRQRSEDKQVVVLRPAHRSQAGRSQEDSSQTPKIDRPVAGMATCTFLT